MSIDALLSRLNGVKKVGDNRWLANCSSHDDRKPSLNIRLTEDGVILLKCWSNGCSAADIVAGVGLSLSDLFPKKTHHRAPSRLSVPASDRLEVIDHEAAVVCVIANDLADGSPVTDEMKKRLHMAAFRIGGARYGV